MWHLQNSHSPDLVIIGNAGDRRVELFQAALARLGLPAARLVEYLDLICGRVKLADTLTPASIVRIESPGRNFEVERALLALGADCEEPEREEHYTRLTRREAEALSFEKGLILPSRQWYLGYSAVLEQIAATVAPEHLFNLPEDIRLMFDKRACHALLSKEGVAVPASLGPVHSYDELLTLMREKHCSQVFVKLAHGSSASGVVAYRWQGARHQATTTVQMVFGARGTRLYNSRMLQVYRQQTVIARLIDALCEQRVQVEQWIPKAGYAGQTFDVRVVTIAGEVCHSVARLSHSPLTNLHLLNKRERTENIRERLGEQVWTRAMADCQRAACLLRILYTGIDVLFSADLRRHALIEMNAFGDLLPGLLYQGEDTYAAEIKALFQRLHHADMLSQIEMPS
ncbi:MAG TPA: STM4014 family protein [Ktedonobacteraceae bacterium]|nr:STM4014 family protein [Ktedonobacteraceae bacterium]